MADSRVDLGAGAPEEYSFGIAGYGVRPRVFVEGRQTGRTPSVALPEGDVLLDISNQNYYGKIGVDVTSPGGDTFGGAASGSYYRGSVDFPEELQRRGAPDRETYSARGIQSPEYSGYYQMKDGPRFEGYYRDKPEGSGIPDEYGGRVSYTIPFENGGEVEKMPNEPRVSSLPYEDRTAIGQFLEDYGPFSALLRMFGTRYPEPVPEKFDALNQYGNPKAMVYGGGTAATTKSALDFPEEEGSKVDLGAGAPSEEGLGYADGGGVGIGKSVTLTQVVPYVDPRSAALGSRLLKQAGVPGDFASLMQSADPKVVEQVNRIMARGPANEISSPSNGLGVFMQSVMPQG